LPKEPNQGPARGECGDQNLIRTARDGDRDAYAALIRGRSGHQCAIAQRVLLSPNTPCRTPWASPGATVDAIPDGRYVIYDPEHPELRAVLIVGSG
jgi:hypothetical protein